MFNIAGNSMEHARMAAQKLSSLPVVNVADGVTNHTNTISNQMSLVTSLSSLLDKVGILVKIGDEVAKVCLCYLCACRTILIYL
jgi:hypothetical protein